MKEHPIIITTSLIPAILADRKTQTRRVIKPQPRRIDNAFDGTWEWKEKGQYYDDLTLVGEALRPNCPYGQVGDRLWVKETFWDDCALREQEGYKQDDFLYYRADGEAHKQFEALEKGFAWTSPRFMPRWASRITLEITNVRVERLREITPAECLAEGISPCEYKGYTKYGKADYLIGYFANLWDSLNAKYKWETNPWVWVIEFRRLISE